MSYGTQQGGDYTYFKIVGLKKGSKELYFEPRVKAAEGYTILEDKPTFIEGHLVSVTPSTFEHEGKTHETLKIILKEGEDSYLLEGGYSNLMVSFINGLLGAETIGRLNLSLYFSNNEKGSFPTMMVRHGNGNGEKLSWDIEYKKIESMKKRTELPGGDFHIDKSKLIDYLKKRIEKELPSKIQQFITPETTPVLQEEDNVDTTTDNGNDDLPF